VSCGIVLSGMSLCLGKVVCCEEAGFQAREHSLQVRVCWKLFPGALGISCSA
jgi:hypothetical protein